MTIFLSFSAGKIKERRMKRQEITSGETNRRSEPSVTQCTQESRAWIYVRQIGLACALLAAVLYFSSGNRAAAQSNESHGVRNVILVHGAWADGSSWSKVVPLLEAKGLKVTAVQLPLTSLTEDVATVKRAAALQDGPYLLVGHSYGGSVITEAGNDPKVAGLVFVAAFAPDNGQKTLDLIMGNPTPAGPELRPTDGFFKLSAKGVFEDFAPDLPEVERKVLFATQDPTAGAAFAAQISNAAWRNKPSWFVIAGNDRVISPKLEEAEAKEMNAKSITIPSSHVVMLAHPVEVAGFIERAAHESGTE
jgi:pimeloyl-ACP methyl ester carboxylesterase